MRRMFRRDRRKGFAPNIPPILQEANMAFEKGEYGRAAERYEKIARVAEARGGPRSPILHLQAGRARVYAQQIELGMPSLKHGLQLLAEHNQLPRLHQLGIRIIAELKERGLEDEATDIDILLKTLLPESFSLEPAPQRPTLPTHCPSCGVPLHTDEMDWLDDITAECAYCGSPVREEK